MYLWGLLEMTTYYSDYLTSVNLTTHSGATTSVHGFDANGKAPPQAHGSTSHSGTIGTESQITFSTSTGHTHTGSSSTVIVWGNISSRPTTISSFTNNSSFQTGYCSYCTYCGGLCDCNCDCNNCAANCGC